MSTLADELSNLVREGFRALEDPNVPVSEILRRCHRIAMRQNDILSIAWLELELLDKDEEPKEVRVGRRAELVAQIDSEVWAVEWHKITESYIRRRGLRTQQGMIFADSILTLERNLQLAKDSIALLGRSDHEVDEKFKFRNGMAEEEAILDRTRVAAHRYLARTEFKLSIGQLGSDAYERNREYVDRHLAELDGPAAEQFQAAHRRSKEGDPEALSHALTSCRRVLKTVADSVYPAKDEPLILEDGSKVKLTDDKYINRLTQSVKDALGSSSPGRIIEETLSSLYARLRALDALSSKGVHSDVTQAEVDICIIQTYLVIGDVLRYRTGSILTTAEVEASIEAEDETETPGVG